MYSIFVSIIDFFYSNYKKWRKQQLALNFFIKYHIPYNIAKKYMTKKKKKKSVKCIILKPWTELKQYKTQNGFMGSFFTEIWEKQENLGCSNYVYEWWTEEKKTMPRLPFYYQTSDYVEVLLSFTAHNVIDTWSDSRKETKCPGGWGIQYFIGEKWKIVPLVNKR